MHIPDKLAADILKSTLDLDATKLEKIANDAFENNFAVQDYILEHKLLSEKAFFEACAKHIGVPFVELKFADLSLGDESKLSAHIISKYKAVVFKTNKSSKLKHVALDNPLDKHATYHIAKFLDCSEEDIKLYLATSSNLDSVLHHYLSRGAKFEARTSKKLVARRDSDPTINLVVQRAVDKLLEEAISLGASDIHIEPRESFVAVRLRVDGVLREFSKLPKTLNDELVNRLKDMSSEDSVGFTSPFYGRFNADIDGSTYSFKVSSLPVSDGEKLLLQILHSSPTVPELSDLGLWGNSLTTLEHALAEPKGLVVVSGPINSGKSTTLYSLVNAINEPGINVVSIEDQVDHNLQGVSQVELKDNLLKPSQVLKDILGSDVNVLMIEDIKDKTSANLIVDSALKGHLILAGLHARDNGSALKHLTDMGVAPHSLAASLRVGVSGRLVRQLCFNCRESFVPDKEFITNIAKLFDLYNFSSLCELETQALNDGLGLDLPQLSSSKNGIKRLFKASEAGCVQCQFTGHKGQLGVFEVIEGNHDVASMLAKGLSTKKATHFAHDQGIVSLKIDALVKVLRGLTSINEALNI